MICIVVPVYNEAERIVHYFPQLFAYLESHFQHEFEVIFVNDGSVDTTQSVIMSLISEHQDCVRCISYAVNRGKGYAIQQGVLASRGEFVVFSDIDLSVAPEVIGDIVLKLSNDYDCVIASRRLVGSRVAVHQPFIREFLGSVYVSLSRFILGVPYSDITCGMKGFTSRTARSLFAVLYCLRWSFDSEVLFLAHKRHVKVYELPVVWSNDNRTKVVLLMEVFRSLSDLIRVRLLYFLGKYPHV